MLCKKSACNKKICINASNLHNGGGVQVAASFIDELSHLNLEGLEVHVYVSTEVNDNINEINKKSTAFFSFVVFNTYGVSTLQPKNLRRFLGFDLVFTIFGPGYMFGLSGLHVVGFAQPWIIYPDNEISSSLSFYRRIIYRLKFFIQAVFFKKASKIIVELEHVRRRLIDLRISEPENIYVVQNCLSKIYFRPELWQPVQFDLRSANFSIGFVGRDYPHKNTNIIPLIKAILLSRYGISVDFYVTFSDAEWQVKSAYFRESVNNVGTLSVAQCPSFYSKVDAVIFPSYLECFSATPLESLAMGRPLFASDRGFVRDVCSDYAFYFDPSDPEAAAKAISEYILSDRPDDDFRRQCAKQHVEEFSSATQRAKDYLEIIRRLTDED